MGKGFSSPLFACLDVTYRCNLDCIHCCFSPSSVTSSVDELTTIETLNFLDELDAMKIISLQFAGGEPFVRDDITEIISRTKSHKYVTSIATNGLYIDKGVASFLKDSNIRHVQVSVDGSSEKVHEFIRGSNTFTKTIEAIRFLVERGIDVSIAAVLHKNNLFDVGNMIKLCYEMNVPRIRFQLLLAQGNAVDNLNVLAIDPDCIRDIFAKISSNRLVVEEKVKVVFPCFAQFLDVEHKLNVSILNGIGCGAGTTSININPYGSISACGILTDDAWMLGNIREESLHSIWNDNGRWHMWRNIEAGVLKGKCQSCDVFSICKGGCRANAILYTNDFYAEDPLCWR